MMVATRPLSVSFLFRASGKVKLARLGGDLLGDGGDLLGNGGGLFGDGGGLFANGAVHVYLQVSHHVGPLATKMSS